MSEAVRGASLGDVDYTATVPKEELRTVIQLITKPFMTHVKVVRTTHLNISICKETRRIVF